MNSIGGFCCIRNAFRLDYGIKECINSMLPICAQLSVSESESDDGTREFLDDWARIEPKLKITSYPWTDPIGDNTWWPTWLNAAREQLDTDYAVYIDSDEAFHEDSYAEIAEASKRGKSLMCNRYNFWRDAQHTIPKGFCCGTDVIRCGPKNLFFPSDYPDPRSVEIQRLAQPSNVFIGHYGFLRHKEAFFQKARVVSRIWAGADSYDPRLEAAEKFEGVWSAMPGVTGWEDKLAEFKGTHPKVIHEWLTARGYST